MKKKLILISTILLSVLSIAGTKEDYQRAVENYQKSNNKDLVSFESDLKKIANQKPDDYTRRANLALLDIKLKQQKLADAQYYAEKLINDSKAPVEIKKQGYIALYSIYDVDVKKRLEVLSKLIELDPKNLEYKVLQISDYIDLNNKTKADMIYNATTKNMYLDEKEQFNTSIASNLIQKSKLNEAKQFLDKNSKLNLKKGLLSRDYLMAVISTRENKLSDALKYILSADKLTEGNDPSVKGAMINIYDLSNDKDKAIAEAINLQKIAPSVDTYLQTIILAEKYNKNDVVKNTLDELKSILKPEDAKALDQKLVQIFFQNGSIETAKKYANKMVDNKDYDGYILLAQIAMYQSNRAEALKNVNLAKKYNVKGAVELEKQILKN